VGENGQPNRQGGDQPDVRGKDLASGLVDRRVHAHAHVVSELAAAKDFGQVGQVGKKLFTLVLHRDEGKRSENSVLE